MKKVKYSSEKLYLYINQQKFSNCISLSLQGLGVISEKTDYKNVFCNCDFVLHCSSKIMCHPVAKSYYWQHVYKPLQIKKKKLYPGRPDKDFTDTSNLIISLVLVSNVIIFCFHSFAKA